jgi:hypothetical protein
MDDQASLGRRVWSAIKLEPLVVFVVLGAALFWAWGEYAPAGVEPLRIDPDAIRALVARQEEQLGRPLTSGERRELTREHIDDEVLLREAFARGLHLGDPGVRERMLGIMSADLVEDVPEPSLVQLQAFFEKNIDDYTISEAVTIDQVFYPWEKTISQQELESVRRALRSGANPARFGNPMIMRTRMPRLARADLVGAFGPGFADRVLVLDDGGWHGPVESFRGIHLVRVVERHPPRIPPFDEIQWNLRRDFLQARQRDLRQERIAEIRRRYEIDSEAQW